MCGDRSVIRLHLGVITVFSTGERTSSTGSR
jgi:hypothetical protein